MAGNTMAGNRAVTYLGPGKVKVQHMVRGRTTAPAGLGIPGLYVTGDPGAADPSAREGAPIPLDEAPRGYQEFDKGAARKYVLDPHGMLGGRS